MKDLLNDIVNKIVDVYGGMLDCEEQRADLFVYTNGHEERIKSISTDTLYFENGTEIKLIDSDISHLAYLNHVI